MREITGRNLPVPALTIYLLLSTIQILGNPGKSPIMYVRFCCGVGIDERSYLEKPNCNQCNGDLCRSWGVAEMLAQALSSIIQRQVDQVQAGIHPC